MRVHKAIVLLGLAAILAWGTAADESGGMKIGIVDLRGRGDRRLAVAELDAQRVEPVPHWR